MNKRNHYFFYGRVQGVGFRYRALYGERGLWVRPAKMWFELIEVDGKQVRRFEPINLSS